MQVHRRGAESAEETQRRTSLFSSLRFLGILCASAVK